MWVRPDESVAPRSLAALAGKRTHQEHAIDISHMRPVVMEGLPGGSSSERLSRAVYPPRNVGEPGALHRRARSGPCEMGARELKLTIPKFRRGSRSRSGSPRANREALVSLIQEALAVDLSTRKVDRMERVVARSIPRGGERRPTRTGAVRAPMGLSRRLIADRPPFRSQFCRARLSWKASREAALGRRTLPTGP